MLEQVRFAFIGGGNMGEALIKGLCSGLNVNPRQIIATDVLPERRHYMQATYGITASGDNRQAVKESDVIVLAVKPQIMPDVLEEIASVINGEKLIISIAAGITLQTPQPGLGGRRRGGGRIPNTPAPALARAAGLFPRPAGTPPEDLPVVRRFY